MSDLAGGDGDREPGLAQIGFGLEPVVVRACDRTQSEEHHRTRERHLLRAGNRAQNSRYDHIELATLGADDHRAPCGLFVFDLDALTHLGHDRVHELDEITAQLFGGGVHDGEWRIRDVPGVNHLGPLYLLQDPLLRRCLRVGRGRRNQTRERKQNARDKSSSRHFFLLVTATHSADWFGCNNRDTRGRPDLATAIQQLAAKPRARR